MQRVGFTSVQRRPLRRAAPLSEYRTNDGRCFALTEKLGSGHNGDIWAVQTPQGSRALKVFHPSIDPHDRTLQMRKAVDVGTTVKHANVVEVFEGAWGELDGVATPYILMERASGLAMDGIVEEQRHPRFSDIAWPRFVAGLVDGVAAFHRHDWLHLDIKPRNLMLLMDSGCKIFDYDWAIRRGTPARAKTSSPFVPPEVANGEQRAIGPWSDLYAVGGVLSCFNMFSNHALQAIVPVIVRLTEENPADRFQSAEQVRSALLEIWPDF